MTGEYSYIDTFCGLITVKYTATPDNYEEKREYEPDFIDCSGATTQAPITTRKPRPTTTTPKPTTTPEGFCLVDDDCSNTPCSSCENQQCYDPECCEVK